MNHRLAIVIPYYKIDFFEETIKSISNQTDKRFSLYIGNDASPNDPLPIIKKYLTEYDYFNYKSNIGGENLVLQWKRVLNNIKEDWFQILGDDDVISPNFVEEFYNNIEEIENKQINVIKISQAFINEKSEQVSEFSSYPKIISTKDFWTAKFLKGKKSSLSEHIFKKEGFLGFKDYPLAWHSDDMAVIESSIPNGIFFLSSTRVLVRFSDKSISGNVNNIKNNILKDTASYLFYLDILNHYYKYIEKDYLKTLIKIEIDLSWKLKYKNRINLLFLYIYLKEPIKILSIPYKEYLLKRNSLQKTN